MKRLRIILLTIFLFAAGSSVVNAQCSMCRRTAETSLEKGETKGRGLNTGILYLMSVPYLMGGVAGLIWWKHRKKS